MPLKTGLQPDLLAQIDRLRQREGLSIVAAATRAKMSQQVWHKWRAGQSSPTIVDLERWADAVRGTLHAEVVPFSASSGIPQLGEEPLTLEAKEVAALIDSQPPEVRTYIVEMVHRLIRNPQQPGRARGGRHREE